MNLLLSKTKNVNSFFILILIFLNITSFLFPYQASADIIYSNNSLTKKTPAQKNIDSIFYKLQEFKPILEPKTEFSDKNENAITLQDFRGNFLIVYFWASWCNSCLDELKQLDKLIFELNYRSIKKVMVLPISIDYKSTNQISEVYNTLKIRKLSIFKDDYKEVMDSMGVKSLPTFFFINQQGYITFKHAGNIAWDNEYLITKLIEIINANNTVEVENNKKEDDTNDKANIIHDKALKKKPIIIN